MKILIAPDKFKGSLSAREACDAIARGIIKFDPGITTIKHPMADGGEGTLDILQNYLPLQTIVLTVRDPLFRPVRAVYKKSETTAFIEMAEASGLALLKEEERNCLYTTTYGTGELLLDAFRKGCQQIYLFVGGSATNDAGMGMAAALGYRFLDGGGHSITPVGKNLSRVNLIDPNGLLLDLNKIDITVVSDVQNVLFGKRGAAFIYAPQKGADEQAVQLLDEGLQHFSDKVKSQLGRDVSNLEGGGAAGGIAAGAVAFLDADLQRGVQVVMETTGFYQKLEGADLVITGEGKFDLQTREGKVVKGVADTCRERNIPVAVICGVSTVGQNVWEEMGISHCCELVSRTVTTEQAISAAATILEERAFDMMKGLSKSLL